MPNSSIQGTVWRWRNGLKPMPLLSEETYKQTRELFLPVSNAMEATKIMNELKENGIRVESKTTHSTRDVVPSGTLIVYASTSEKDYSNENQENMEKLENYIKEHGGKVPEKEKQTARASFFSKLFGRGGK